MKLSAKQKEALRILQKYPNEIVMTNGSLTGGHGVRLDMRTVISLKERGLIETWGERRDRISELGKSIPLTNPE